MQREFNRREALHAIAAAAASGVFLTGDAFAQSPSRSSFSASNLSPLPRGIPSRYLTSSFSLAGRAPTLDIVLCNAWGKPIACDGEVEIQPILMGARSFTESCPNGNIAIPGTQLVPGAYELTAKATPFHDTRAKISLPARPGATIQEKVRMRIGLDESRAVFDPYTKLPSSFHRVLDASSNNHGEEFCHELSPLVRAGLFNILSRSAITKLADGSLAIDHVQELRAGEIQRDRFFAKTSDKILALLQEGVARGDWTKSPGKFHKRNDGFKQVGNFKTKADPENGIHAVLNLAVYHNPETDEYILEGDIDHSGPKHLVHSWSNHYAKPIVSLLKHGRWETATTHPHDVGQLLAGDRVVVDGKTMDGVNTHYYLVAA